MHVEVKGRSPEGDIELTGNETEAAKKYAETFYLIVVCGVPETPRAYQVRNPISVGKTDKLTVSAKIWKAHPM